MSERTIDNFLRLRKYSFIFIVLTEFTLLLQTGNQIFMSFAGSNPHIIGCSNQMNSSFSPDYDFCPIVENGSCVPIYKNDFGSVNEKWDMVCSKSKLVKDSTSYQMLGSLLGTVVFGQISDRFGRRWVNFAAILLTSLFGIATVFSPTFTVFTILRVITSFMNAGHTVVIMCYMCETFPKKHRMWLGFILSWSPNIVLVSGIAWMSREWKTYSLIVNGLAIVPLIITLFVKESPYYMLKNKKYEETTQILMDIARIDNVKMNTAELEKTIENLKIMATEKPNRNYNVFYLFYSWKLVFYTLSLCLCYFCVNLINYAVFFNMDTLSGSLFVNLFMLGSLRFLITIVSSVVDYNCGWFGRKVNHSCCAVYSLCAIGFVFAAKLFDLPSSVDLAVRLLFVSAGSVVAQLGMVTAVTSNEIYPAPIRNSAYGVILLSANCGSIIAPQLYSLNKLFASAPDALMFVVLVVEYAMNMVFIPESKGKPLVDEMPTEDQRIFRRKRVGEVTSEKA